MPRVYVEVDGLDELIKEFKAMPKRGKARLAGAVNKGAGKLAPKIRQATPVGTEDGKHLRDNIKVRKAKGKTAKATAEVYISGKSTDYGFHVETGHLTKGGRHIPAKPFMRNTTDANAEEIATIVAEEILDGVGV